jgi:hypothetical protein
MGGGRKKPGVAFWVTVVVLMMLVGYPLSFGPLVWLDNRVSIPMWQHDCADAFFYPLTWICIHYPTPFGEMLDWYANLWR